MGRSLGIADTRERYGTAEASPIGMSESLGILPGGYFAWRLVMLREYEVLDTQREEGEGT